MFDLGNARPLTIQPLAVNAEDTAYRLRRWPTSELCTSSQQTARRELRSDSICLTPNNDAQASISGSCWRELDLAVARDSELFL